MTDKSTETAAETAAPAAEQEDILTQAAAISDDRRKRQAKKLAQGFDEREAFENLNSPANTGIQAKLKGYRAKIVQPGIAALTLAAKIDPNFMNGSGVSEKKRFNVYAIQKLADLLHGLNRGHFENAVNRCIVESLFRTAKAGMPFNSEAARAAVSQNIRVSKDLDAVLTRHTVAPGTANTQMSSTMSALALLGAVRNTGSVKAPNWELTDTPVTKRMKEMVGI